MRLNFCGTRGSTQAVGAEFLRYGGHTSCVAVSHGEDAVPTLILDAGTGLREVTALMAGRPFAGTILLSHACAEAVLERGMSPPHFPIRPRDLRGAWTFGTLVPGRHAVEGFTVQAREIPHKGGKTFGYRISDGKSVIAYLPDHCPTNLGPGPDCLGEYHAAAVELAKGADVLVHDASLLPEEVAADASFGHAAADYAVGLAVAAGARRVVLFHHRPNRTDTELDDLGGRLARGPVPVTVAADKGILEL